MRSSIACSRCRRSKIKCVNAGIDTTCRACENSNRECVYPTPAIAIGGAKRDLTAAIDGDNDRNGDWDSPKRQRSRKTAPTTSGGRDVTKAADVLDSSILTLKVWETLFDLFQAHYATILPFLHPTTFLNQIRQVSSSSSTSDGADRQSPRPEPSPLILLGVLALTARFHPQLVVHHSPPTPSNPSNPLVASEYYAAALRSRLAGSDGLGLAVPELSRVQALLMLALHEWDMCRGKNAWVYAGVAIRLSQAMGLPYELDNEAASRPPSIKWETDYFGIPRRRESREQSSDDIILEETKRRTFWACFILDRCLSSGKYRPRMVKVRDLGIQLPSDNAFAFGERVRTSRLSDSSGRRPLGMNAQDMQIPSLRQSLGYADDQLRPAGSPSLQRGDSVDHGVERWEVGAEESVLSRVIRIIRIWGSVAKWACAGGRRTDPYPPWQPESRFAQLRGRLSEFQETLPRNLQYSPRNTDTHIMYKHKLPSYTVMHVVYFLSVIVLHRAYLPFLPLRCSEPAGPLDEPTYSRDKYAAPEGFWRDSAREVFRAARQVMDLATACQERGVLVESPLVGFALYHAALMGVYAAHFGQMDVEGMLTARRPSTDVTNSGSSSSSSSSSSSPAPAPARRSLEILRDMRPRLKMAVGWFRTLNRLHSYYTKVKRDYARATAAATHTEGFDGNNLRPGGAALEEYKVLEKVFLEFGEVEDRLQEDNDDGTAPAAAAVAAPGLSTSSDAVKSESGDSPSPAALPRRESWVVVNGTAGPSHSPTVSTTTAPPTSGGNTASLAPKTDTNELDRRPSLPPPPPGRTPLPPQSGFSLPSIQQSTAFPPSPAATGNRLQPLSSWAGPPPPPSYGHSLPPINSSSAPPPPPHNYPRLPPPSTVAAGAGAGAPPGSGSTSSSTSTSSNGGNSPPALATTTASSHPLPTTTTIPTPGPTASSSLWTISLGGDDVVAFIEGGTCDTWSNLTDSEVGYPSGWLAAVWNDL